MANKRMFSIDVVNTDRFLDMPSTSQNLYFHLGMRADDDGFVSSPKQITRMVNAGGDDLKLLITKGFLIPFSTGVVVIKDWRVNNYIRKDRYTETRHKVEKEQLYITNDIYEKIDTGTPIGIPDDNHVVTERSTQVRLGKDSINNMHSPEGESVSDAEKLEQQNADFEKIYAIYPKKRGRTRAFQHYRNWLKGKMVNGIRKKLTEREMYLAVYNYVSQEREKGTELDYYKNFDTLMGNQLLDFIVED